jgi:hypothetical protein
MPQIIASVRDVGTDLTPPAAEPNPCRDAVEAERAHGGAALRVWLRAEAHTLGQRPVMSET